MRAKTHYVTDEGQVKEHVNATRWIGIYASRPDLPSVASGTEEDRRAEVGFFYKSGNVMEVITQGIPGPDFGLAS